MRVWPVATAGRLDAYAYDSGSRSFAMVATATGVERRADWATDTIVYILSTAEARYAPAALPSSTASFSALTAAGSPT